MIELTVLNDNAVELNTVDDGLIGLDVVMATGGGSEIHNQNKTVTPTESEQSVTADAGYTGLGTVTVEGIDSEYVGSDIPRNTSSSLLTEGATVIAPSGYYENSATKTVQMGTAGTPTASKGAVSNHSVSVTPSVTNQAGYIYSETKTGTAVSVSASELVSGTKSISANGTEDVTNYASVSVAVPNSYSASDEGKVVDNGALVSQTSATYTANDTYDTTLINEVTVNVSGGGGASVTSISAVYTPSTTVFLSTNLSELYDDLVVTATIGISLQVIVSSDEYALSGTLAIGTNTITVSYGGQSTTFTVTATEIYERKTYIESDGNCYIDLGFTPDQRCVITVDYMSLKASGTPFQTVFGVTPKTDGTLSNEPVVALQIYSANTINWACSMSGSTATLADTWGYQERKTASINCTNHFFFIDGEYVTSTMTSPLSGTVNANMYLFGRNGGGVVVSSMAVGRCYSFTVVSHLVNFRDCVPVRKLSNGEYGLLDLVFGVFYGASGSGTLTGA